MNVTFPYAFVFFSLLISAGSDRLEAEDWPRFRGPGGSGVSSDADFPTIFSPTDNVAWKIDFPGGTSSPCVTGGRIVLTAYHEDRLHVICVDASTGERAWSRELKPGRIEKGGSRLGNPAASTSASDGQGVYSYFGSFGLIAHDLGGRELWRRPLPLPITQHGAAASPIVIGNLVIVPCDQDRGSYLLAVDRSSGKTVWRTERPGFRRGFATPIVWPPGDPRLVVLPGTLRLVAYDLKGGKIAWSVKGLPNEMVSSPVGGAGLIFSGGWTHGSGVKKMPGWKKLLEESDANGDGKLQREEALSGPARQQFVYIDANKDNTLSQEEWESMATIFEQSRNAFLAVRPPDVSGKPAEVLWSASKGLPYVASPLFYRGRVYFLRNGGILSCFDAKSGKVLFARQRIGALGNNYASPVAASGKILIGSQRGEFVVLEAADEFKSLAKNRLGEEVLATPAIVGKRLFVRTAKSLYAFEVPEDSRVR